MDELFEVLQRFGFAIVSIEPAPMQGLQHCTIKHTGSGWAMLPDIFDIRMVNFWTAELKITFQFIDVSRWLRGTRRAENADKQHLSIFNS